MIYLGQNTCIYCFNFRRHKFCHLFGELRFKFHKAYSGKPSVKKADSVKEMVYLSEYLRVSEW